MRWEPAPIAGGAYSDDAMPWTCQDTVNYLPVPAERAGTRSPSILRSAPGFSTFCASMQEAPVRGLHNVEGLLLAVTGSTLYRIGTDGAATSLGTIPGVQRVTMAHNKITDGFEVMVANGQSGYVYNTVTGALAQVTDEGFPGMKVCDFVDGYIAGVEPFGRYWLHSNLNAATDYNTIDRYSAESAPDKIQSLIVSHREVMVLGERTCNFYRNTGAATGTFQNYNGTEMEVGCASPHAVARLDNSVFWLGHDGTVRRLEGHAAVRISTGPIEQAISRCNAANAFAFTFEDRGHKVFYLTLPDGQTWGFDVWSREWHRRRSKDLDRWRLSALVRWNGAWIGGDFSNGRLYQLDWLVQSEAGEEMEKRRITPVLHDNQNRVTVNAVDIVVDTGLPEGGNSLLDALTISGDLPDGDVGIPIEPFSYTASGGVLPLGSFSLVDPAAFPPGLTMDANGNVTGTPTQGGVFAWTVQIADADGTVATHEDSAEIWVTQWLLTQSDTSVSKPYLDAVWIGEDVTDWTGSTLVRRDPFTDLDRSSYGGGYLQVADNVAIGAGLDGNIERAVGFGATDAVATTVETGAITGTPCRIRRFGDLVIITTSDEAFYYTSEDAGLTWTQRAAPSSRIYDIAKVGDRWVTEGSGIDGFFYSDDAVPATWVAASSTDVSSNSAGGIASNGTVAVKIGSLGRVFRTADGLSWAETGVQVATAMTSAVAIDDYFVFAANSGVNACRSTDAGLTFADVTLPFNVKRMDAIDGLMVFCTVGGGLYYSTDGGATLSPSAMPVPFDSSETFFAAKFRYLP